MDNESKKHHFLISGLVMFVNKTTSDIGTVSLNGVLLTDQRNIPVQTLGKAQQILQFNFHSKAPVDGEIEVVDVIIHNLVHLGEMTEAEFKATPPGVTLQEAKAAVSAAVGQDAANG